MGLYSQITTYIENQMNNNPNAEIVFGVDRVDVSMDTNQAGSTDLSRRIQAAVGKFIIGRHPAARAITRFLTLAEIGAKLQPYYHKGDMAEGMAEESLGITYDPYTESILAEVESSQQTESRLESAPSFIRPKKKKELLYK